LLQKKKNKSKSKKKLLQKKVDTLKQRFF